MYLAIFEAYVLMFSFNSLFAVYNDGICCCVLKRLYPTAATNWN